MICYVDEEKLSFNRKLREGAGGKSNGSSGSKGRDSKSSSKPKPSTSNNHKASRDSSNDANSMRKEQQSIRKYNNNNNNKNNNKASRDSSNDANFMRKEQQSVREYNKEYNNNLKYDSAINANSMRKEQQAEREFNKAYNNSLKYDSTINTDTMKQEQLVIRKINNYLNRNNASDANLMKQEQLMIKKIDAYNGHLKANADGLNGASYSIKNSVTGLNEAITIIDKIKNVSGNNLSQQETNLAMQLASLEALLIEANAGTKNIDKIVNNIMDMYTRFEKQQSGKKEIILNEYGKPDLKNWTAEAVLDYAEKEVNNYFTGLHNKQIKENLKNSKTIGEAMGYMGDIAGSTISNALYNISKGVAKSFENVDDALHSAYLLLKDGNKTWTNEKLKDAGKEVQKSKFEETIHNILFSPTKFKDPKMEKLGTKDWNDWSIEENIKDIIGDKTTNWFNTNFKLNEKDQNGITRLEKFEKNSLLTESSLGGQVMQNFGQMVPNIVLGNVFGAAASLGTLYAKSFGSSAESAYNMGATIDDASTYAALSAGVEVFTEKMFGIVGGIVPKGSGWLDNVITYASKTGELLGGVVGEVFEEHLSNLAQPFIKKVTINRDSSIREMMKEDFLDAFKDTTLVTLGTTALCNLLGYSMGAIKAKIEYNNVLEYSNNIPEGSKTLINEIIKYDDTSTTSQPEKIQSIQQKELKVKSFAKMKPQEIVDNYINNKDIFAGKGISIEKYLQDGGIKITKISSMSELSRVMKDPKLFLFDKAHTLFNNPNISQQGKTIIANIINYCHDVPNADWDIGFIVNELAPFLTTHDSDLFIEFANNGVEQDAHKLTTNQKAAVFNYTACGGLEICAWLNNVIEKDGKRVRDRYKSINQIQDIISGHKLYKGYSNRIFPSYDGDIVQTLDSIIAQANYDNALVVYRGVREIYDINQLVDVNKLAIGDTITTPAFQSSSILEEKCYAYDNDDVNIMLEIIVLPNSGTAAYIENISGVSNYGQTEVLIKRSGTLTVIDNTYKKIINGVEKTIVPVVLT